MRSPQSAPASPLTRRLSLSLRRDDPGLRRATSRDRHSDSLKSSQSLNSRTTKSPTLRSPSPPPSLDLLTDQELLNLTRNNTKKNHGGRKSRFRSQMERVCRRLDNMAIEARLQQRQLLEALPIVEPQCPRAVDAFVANPHHSITHKSHTDYRSEEPSSAESVTDTLLLDSQSEDCFAIEPATNDSVFSSRSTKSLASTGRPKSVRISTSVCFLEYKSNSKEQEPLSISTCSRFEHPTRKNRDALLRRGWTDEMSFSRAQMKMRSRTPIRESIENGLVQKDSENNQSAAVVPQTADVKKPTAPLTSEAEPIPTTLKPLASHQRSRSPPSPQAAYAVPSPHGPYGPRVRPR